MSFSPTKGLHSVGSTEQQLLEVRPPAKTHFGHGFGTPNQDVI